MNDEATAPDLPRVRVHDDGAVALALERFDPSRVGHWRSIVPPSATSDGHTGGLLSTVEVYTPGWRDAVIVPLPEPDEIHERAGTGWRAIEVVVWASQTTIFDGTHLLGASGARELAAALLAAAAHVDQAEEVSGG